MQRILALLIPLLFFSCSSHNIHEELRDSAVNTVQKVVVVVRISSDSDVDYTRFVQTLKAWLLGHGIDGEVDFLPKENTLSYFSGSDNSFYQRGGDGTYLTYKSIGVIKSFAVSHKSEINKVMETYGADGVLFYEIEGAYSPTLKIIRYSSVVTCIMAENKVAYIDHQERNLSDGDYNSDYIQKEFYDLLAQRLYSSLKDMKIVKQ